MSDLVIRSGGVVDVDTASLRAVSRTLANNARELAELRARVVTVVDAVVGGATATRSAIFDVTLLRTSIESAEREAESLAEAVSRSAALYEAVELYIARDAAAAAGDQHRVDLLDARLGLLAASDPETVSAARRALDDTHAPHRDLYAQAFLGGLAYTPAPLWLAFPLLFATVDRVGLGPVAAGSRLAGPDVPVHLRTTSTGPTTPPATLAAAAARLPSGDARVRVERYSLPSGGRSFFVYVAGTSSSGGASQAFDMRSNLQLYGNEKSASYSAVTGALRDAGARQGDVVHGFGHSQGAMVLERLALEGEYEMQSLVSFGSPVQADVGADTLSVTVRHTDDPVAALQSGGHPGGVGAPGSFVVERVGDPSPGFRDLEIPTHQMVEYAETAALIDSSNDPRVDALRDVFARWRDGEGEGWDSVATRVDVTREVTRQVTRDVNRHVTPDGGAGAG